MARRSAGSWSRWVVAGALLLASAVLLANSGAGARAEGPGGAGGAARSEPDARLVELGRRLFFEPALSARGQRSCASCHDPAHGFSDPAVRSADDDGPTPRHSQSLIDVDGRRGLHWDGGIVDLQEITQRRMTSRSGGGYDAMNLDLFLPEAAEVGTASGSSAQNDLGPSVFMVRVASMFDDSSTASPVLRLGARYGSALLAACDRGQTMADLCKDALAAYVTALRSNTSSYDRFVGDEPAALSASARRGLDLFRGRAACAECHLLGSAGERAPFRDGKFHNTGVAWLGRPQKEQRGRIEDMLRMNNGFDPEGTLRARLDGDPGRGAHDPRLNATRTFKTPTLRDVARHAPYMHDGALPTLAAVVRHYAGGCGDDAKRDPRLKGFEASDADVADLVAFLESLTSETRPGLAESPWVRRVSWTRLRFVDATGRPLAGLKVTATPAGDLAGKQSGAPEPFVVTTDDAGQVKFNTTPFTHVRLSLADGLALHDGAWVPDTCHETTLVVSTAGTARLALVLPSGLEAPDELRLWRRTARGNIVFLDDFAAQDAPLVQVEPAPWSFVRHGSMKIDGKSAALYTGWCPEGSRKMLFRLAGQEKPQSVELVPDEILSVAVLP